MQRAIHCWTFTPAYQLWWHTAAQPPWSHQETTMVFFHPLPSLFSEGEILMQMSDTQRLLSSDLEVVVSGFPWGWCASGDKSGLHILHLAGISFSVPTGRCCLPAIPAARDRGVLQSCHSCCCAIFGAVWGLSPPSGNANLSGFMLKTRGGYQMCTPRLQGCSTAVPECPFLASLSGPAGKAASGSVGSVSQPFHGSHSSASQPSIVHTAWVWG